MTKPIDVKPKTTFSKKLQATNRYKELNNLKNEYYELSLSKEKKQTKGKTRLTNMLKTGKPLQIFTIKAEDLKKFSQEAKKYGILYCALANKKNSKILKQKIYSILLIFMHLLP